MAKRILVTDEIRSLDSQYMQEQASAPATPATGQVVVYAKTDGKVYSKDDAGTETELGGGSAGANQTLSNLTSPTAINQDLLPTGDFSNHLGSATLRWQNAHVANIHSGASPLVLDTGDATTPQSISITSNGGVVLDDDVNSGDVVVSSGAVTGTANSGNVNIVGGNAAAGVGGNVNITSGSGGTGGTITLNSASGVLDVSSTQIINLGGITGNYATDSAKAMSLSSVQARSGVYKLYTVDLAATFTDAATSQSVELFTLQGGEVIHNIIVKTDVAAAGGTITQLDLSTGITGDVAIFSSPYDVVPATSATNFQNTMYGSPYSFSATPFMLTATATGDNLSELTAGQVRIWVKCSDITTIDSE